MTNEMEPSVPANPSTPAGHFDTDTWYTVSFKVRPKAYSTDWDRVDDQYLANVVTTYFAAVVAESTATLYDQRQGKIAAFDARDFVVEPEIEISDDDLHNLLGGSQDDAGD